MRKALVGIATIGTIAAMVLVAPAAFGAPGGGGGGGGSGKPSNQPTVYFKSGSMSSPESTSTVAVAILRSSKGYSTVNFRTVGGSATAAPAGTPSCDPVNHPEWDYLPADMLVTFDNQATQQGFVKICDNSMNEGSETVIVQLYGPSAGTSLVVGKQQATLNIVDNDPAATVSIANATASDEGTNQDFVVSLTGSTALPVSATVSTADFTPAFGKAISGLDYIGTTTSFSWAPGDNTTRTFTVTLQNDPVDEPAETYKAVLTSVINASGQGSYGTGTINDTDAAPTVSIADNSSAEGDSGQGGRSFTVSVSGPTASNIHVTWSTSAVGTATGWNIGDARNDCAFNGSDGTDLVSAAGGFLDFTASASTPASQNVVVQVCGDTTLEPDETFLVELDPPSYGSLADGVALGTIQNDDDDDGDGVSDVNDLCAGTPSGESVDSDGCSSSQIDTDSDGVYNNVDNCVNAPNPGQEDVDGYGAGDACDDYSELAGTSTGSEDGNDGSFGGSITNTMGHPNGTYDGQFTNASATGPLAECGGGDGFFVDGTVTLTYGSLTATFDLDMATSYFCVDVLGATPALTTYAAHWAGSMTSGTGPWAGATGALTYDGHTSAQDGSGIRTDSLGIWSGYVDLV